MVNISQLVRENIVRLTPYSCARDEYKGSTGIFLDANESPYGNLNRYPDPYQKELKVAVSEYKKISEEKIFLGNGSDEIIDLCMRIFCNPGVDKVLTFPPTYGMYEVSAAVNDISVIKVPLNSDFQIDKPKVKPILADKNLKIIFICSPNNPTGNSMNRIDIEEILKDFRGIVLIDEAYIDFSEKQSFINLIDKYSNLIIMQTFSKAFGMAAVRVGMAFSGIEIIQLLNKVKPPYNISSINQKAVLKRINKARDLKGLVTKIQKEKIRVSTALKKLKIIENIYPSDANFLLVKVKDANYTYNTLVNNNIITRNRTSVVQNCIRITIGKRSENNLLIKTLKSIGV
jgi:histidinol-phosphate aminotransferase